MYLNIWGSSDPEELYLNPPPEEAESPDYPHDNRLHKYLRNIGEYLASRNEQNSSNDAQNPAQNPS